MSLTTAPVLYSDSGSLKKCSRSFSSRKASFPRPELLRPVETAIIIASGYARQNIIQDVWAEIFDISQPGVSRIITEITPLIEKATAEFRPGTEEAKAAARGQTVLVDGFLAPCWSWRGIPGLWSGKHKTTGFCSQVISDLAGDVIFVSEPLTGHNHDMTVLSETKTAEIIAEAFSGIGDKGYQGSGYITVDEVI